MSNNLDSALKALRELSLSANFNVKIPSTQAQLTFKQLNTDQLKQILKTIADAAIFNSSFNTTLYNILKENLLTPDTNLEDLTIYDIQYITLLMRVNSLSENYTVYFTNDEIKSYKLPGSKHEFNLKELVNHKNLQHIPDETIIENSIQVICQVPTVKNENEFINYITNNIDKFYGKNLENVVGEIFLYEIVKSIKEVIINGINTDFSFISFEEKIEIIKQLPTILTSKIIHYIEKYKQALYDLYLVDIQTQIQDRTFILQKELQYNGTLFNY